MIIEIIGWIGSALVILAYGLNTFQKIASTAAPYHLMNIVGSACLIINTFFHEAFPSTAVNVVWIIIAVSAYIKNITN